MEKINLNSQDMGPDFSSDGNDCDQFSNSESSDLDVSENNEEEEEVESRFEEEAQAFLEKERERKQEKKPKFYHVSDKNYEIGEIIEGRSSNGQFKDVVFLTDSEEPHYTLEGREMKNAFIYKVTPLSGVKGGDFWDELVSKRVKVIERLGNAKGFLNKNKTSAVRMRKFKQEEDVRFNSSDPKDNLDAGKKLLENIEKKYGRSKTYHKKEKPPPEK